MEWGWPQWVIAGWFILTLCSQFARAGAGRDAALWFGVLLSIIVLSFASYTLHAGGFW